VAKHPIYPPWPSSQRPPLFLEPRFDPNDLYSWDVSLEEEELEPWVPWWAPRCVIGNLYVPFHCAALELSESGIAKLKELCGGEITHDNWLRGECSTYEEPFDGATRIDRIHVYHRLPIWLITLPSRTRLVPCLYASAASVDYRFDFQMIRHSSMARIFHTLTGSPHALFTPLEKEPKPTGNISGAKTTLLRWTLNIMFVVPNLEFA
jgi:hypothetical protein